MVTTAPRPRVTREPVEETVERLQTFIRRMEHRYELSSVEMEAAVSAGTMRETAEVSRWLTACHFLRDLLAHGNTTGSPTNAT